MREKYSFHLAIITGALIVFLAVIFAWIQSPDLFEITARPADPIPHPLQGYEECEACHGVKEEIPYTIRHLGWSIKSCTRCHAPSDIHDEAADGGAGIVSMDASGVHDEKIVKRTHQ
ncbi:MAG TPA: hypothetical protein VKB81_17255 [Nitrospira sp.]|nr:hypothetical protein [Nitrospira sp.]